MELNEAIETLRENGFILEDVSPDNKMIYRGKATNLYKAAVCCLKHDNYARSRDLLADDVVTNWHNLTPLMMKTSDSGQKYFKNTVSSSPNASYFELTKFGYEMYKQAAEYLGDNVLEFKTNEENNAKIFIEKVIRILDFYKKGERPYITAKDTAEQILYYGKKWEEQ